MWREVVISERFARGLSLSLSFSLSLSLSKQIFTSSFTLSLSLALSLSLSGSSDVARFSCGSTPQRRPLSDQFHFEPHVIFERFVLSRFVFRLCRRQEHHGSGARFLQLASNSPDLRGVFITKCNEFTGSRAGETKMISK